MVKNYIYVLPVVKCTGHKRGVWWDSSHEKQSQIPTKNTTVIQQFLESSETGDSFHISSSSGFYTWGRLSVRQIPVRRLSPLFLYYLYNYVTNNTLPLFIGYRLANNTTMQYYITKIVASVELNKVHKPFSIHFSKVFPFLPLLPLRYFLVILCRRYLLYGP